MRHNVNQSPDNGIELSKITVQENLIVKETIFDNENNSVLNPQ